MKKEVLLAIMIGLTMGLLITYGIYRVQSAINQPPVTDVLETATESAGTAETAPPTVIALHSPLQGAVQTDGEVIITGTTIPDSNIVIFINNDETITKSDKSGSFTHNATLESGTNIIRVHVIDAGGNSAVQERVVVVSDIFERLASPDASVSAEVATPSAETDN